MVPGILSIIDSGTSFLHTYNPSLESTLTNCQLAPQELIFVKFPNSNIIIEESIWKSQKSGLSELLCICYNCLKVPILPRPMFSIWLHL